jgi:chromatin structure-remodeling complex subunit SFH1
MDRGWTWLGDRVPGERVRSQRMPMTKHQYL